ncbi:hypothetical protein LG3211_0194 [Lysobacter gummosus]|nr:hypothetical protein LG3211_0194 [Lysobacter gummosus]
MRERGQAGCVRCASRRRGRCRQESKMDSGASSNPFFFPTPIDPATAPLWVG